MSFPSTSCSHWLISSHIKRLCTYCDPSCSWNHSRPNSACGPLMSCQSGRHEAQVGRKSSSLWCGRHNIKSHPENLQCTAEPKHSLGALNTQGWDSQRVSAEPLPCTPQRFSQWSVLWWRAAACDCLQWHLDNFPSDTPPQRHFKRPLKIKNPSKHGSGSSLCVPPQGESALVFLPEKVIKWLFIAEALDGATAGCFFNRVTTHIWRAPRWSQSLNITTAASVWESSTSAVAAAASERKAK